VTTSPDQRTSGPAPDRRTPGPARQDPQAAEQAEHAEQAERAEDQRPPEQRTAEPRSAGGRAAEPAGGAVAGEAPAAGQPGTGTAPGTETRAPGPRRPAAAAGTGAGPGRNGAAGPAGPRDLPRWVRWTVLPLLVLVPLGYVIISAQQSRESGESKQQEAAVRQLVFGYYPSPLQQRIYEMPIPFGAGHVGVLETNSWDTSVLFTQFTTTAGGLDTFLAKVGTSREALHAGASDITASQRRTAGWTFTGPGPYSGTSMQKPGDKPDHAITVDLHDPDAPTVYVVSTVNFQHGFGGN
jgi:hypothetical protein